MSAQPRPAFAFRPAPEQCGDGTGDQARTVYPVAIVGAGMVGLTLALDLARRGVSAVVLERGATVSEGSRSICQAKRTLEIWDRLGACDGIVERGVGWTVGRTFHGTRELYRTDLLPETGHRMPAFVNLQQYLVEEQLIAALLAAGGDIRWHSRVAAVQDTGEHVEVQVDTPAGSYTLGAAWLIACDGVRSTVRSLLGLGFEGRTFADKFLIADVRIDQAAFPAERWFWFEPPFHDGQTALLHRQADDVWRIDLQLGRDADPRREQQEAVVRPRIRALLGHDAFELVWVSVYAFQSRTLTKYVHGRIVFAGDAAHQVSPFGARGGNGGVQDADNLGWKLASIVLGTAPVQLLATYEVERLEAARENVLHSTRATDFMSPRSAIARRVRDAVLEFAHDFAPARALVNSGRLSQPAHYRNSPLNTPGCAGAVVGPAPGSPAVDAPVLADGAASWLLQQFGSGFSVLATTADVDDLAALVPERGMPFRWLRVRTRNETSRTPPGVIDIVDCEGAVARRYGLDARPVYLIRPDHHVAARWLDLGPDPEARIVSIREAVSRALARGGRAVGLGSRSQATQ